MSSMTNPSYISLSKGGSFIRSLSLGLFLLLLSASLCMAQNATTHKVQSGETLFGIAEEYEVSVQQLRKWNNLTSDRLSIGQTLVIKKQAETPGSESGITHTIQPKETLYSISKKYGVGIDEIKEWNNLQGQNLQVGGKLKIFPEKSEQQSSTGNTQGKSYYTVRSGDSLFRIARVHNMTVKRLKELNNLSSDNIQVGQKLAVQPTDQPPSLTAAGVESTSQGKFIRYTVEKSQSRKELLETFQMDETEFRALNPGLNTTSFRRGDEVTLLAPANRSFTNPYTTGSSMSSLGSTRATRYETSKVITTTSGELYNPESLTAAHSNMAMGSVIFVKNSRNNRGVFVRINDRTTGEGLKLSHAAWQSLALSGNAARIMLYRSNE